MWGLAFNIAQLRFMYLFVSSLACERLVSLFGLHRARSSCFLSRRLEKDYSFNNHPHGARHKNSFLSGLVSIRKRFGGEDVAHRFVHDAALSNRLSVTRTQMEAFCVESQNTWGTWWCRHHISDVWSGARRNIHRTSMQNHMTMTLLQPVPPSL